MSKIESLKVRAGVLRELLSECEAQLKAEGESVPMHAWDESKEPGQLACEVWDATWDQANGIKGRDSWARERLEPSIGPCWIACEQAVEARAQKVFVKRLREQAAVARTKNGQVYIEVAMAFEELADAIES